ncbi:hypothetical protein V8C86DRAFT_3152203 [Haematococcus lacustris]
MLPPAGATGSQAKQAAAATHTHTHTHGFSLNNTGDSDVEEFSPGPSQPTNPLAPLLRPFTMMKPLVPTVASRATAAAMAGIKRPWQRRAAAAAAAAAAAPPHMKAGAAAAVLDSHPPMGYLWLWMGNFLRWQRRFMVASEAPGVVLIYKRMNMKGKVWSISLRGAVVQEDELDPRQFKIITSTGQIYLRAPLPEERPLWVECLQQSISLFMQSQTVVEELKDKGLLPPQVLNASSGRRSLTLPSLPASLPHATDMDMEQRRRVRARMTERLSEIVPYQQEVERHMTLLSSQLLGMVSSLNIRLPALTASNSLLKFSTSYAATPRSNSGPSPSLYPTPDLEGSMGGGGK